MPTVKHKIPVRRAVGISDFDPVIQQLRLKERLTGAPLTRTDYREAARHMQNISRRGENRGRAGFAYEVA